MLNLKNKLKNSFTNIDLKLRLVTLRTKTGRIKFKTIIIENGLYFITSDKEDFKDNIRMLILKLAILDNGHKNQ